MKFSLMITIIFLFALGTVLADSTDDKLFPGCMVHKGVIDPDFFNDINKISGSLSQTCSTDADPRWKARIYLQNLRDFALHAPLVISNEAKDFIDTKQNDGIISIDKKSGIKVKKNSETMVARGFMLALFLIPEVGLAAGKAFEYAVDAGMRRVKPIEVGETVNSSLNEELNKVMKARDEINLQFRNMHDELNKILDHIKNPESVSLNKDQQKFLRSVICRFMPKMMGYRESGPRGLNDERYDQFCSDEGGPGNYNRERGTLSCTEANALEVGQREKLYNKLKANLARNLAENTMMPDPFKIMEDGTPTRIEVMITDYRNQNQTSSIGFRSPGGIKVLCSILRDPEYDKYFEINGKSRKLKSFGWTGMFKRNILRLGDVKLPIALIHKEGNYKYPDVHEFHYDKDGNGQKVRINHHKSRDFSYAYEKYAAKYSKGVKEKQMYELVGNKCDD